MCVFCLLPIESVYGGDLIPPLHSLPPSLQSQTFCRQVFQFKGALFCSIVKCRDEGAGMSYFSLANCFLFLLSCHYHVFSLSNLLPEAMYPESATSGPLTFKFLPFSQCCGNTNLRLIFTILAFQSCSTLFFWGLFCLSSYVLNLQLLSEQGIQENFYLKREFHNGKCQKSMSNRP